MRLHASLFGRFHLATPDGTELVVAGKRAQALLAILCVQPGVAVEREQCCQLLWPGKFTAHARASLRQTLLGLKQQLAPIHADFLVITRERVAKSAKMAECAMKAIELDPGQGHARAMLGIHRWTENDCASAQAQQNYYVDITSQTGYTIMYMYVSPGEARTWEEDVLGHQVLRSGHTTRVTLRGYRSPIFDIRLVDEDGDTYTFWNVDVSRHDLVVTLANLD